MFNCLSFVKVFGVPDVRMGEEVAAWVKLNDGAEKINAQQIQVWCKEKVNKLVDH